MALATGADLVARYDARRLAELVSDAGVRPDPSTVRTNDNLLVALDDATQMLVAAVRVGSRYTLLDLALDPPPSVGGNGRSLVKRLICDLAFGLLTARRGYAADEAGRLAPRYGEALQLLQQLRDGERVLDADGVADAGLPATEPFRPLGSATPSLLSDAHRFFGSNPSRGPSYRW